MQSLYEIRQNNFIFNHRIYDLGSDKVFAMHAHNLYEIIFVRSGNATYSIENEIYHASKNDVIIIKPFTYHFFRIDCDTTYEKIGLLFDATTMRLDISFIKHNFLVSNDENDIVHNTFEKLLYYYRVFDGETFTELCKACTREIVLNASLINTPPPQFNHHSPIISAALKYINDNLFTIESIAQISNALFVSKNYFLSLFSHEMNVSPKKYITEKRLLHARTLLRNGEKPSVVYEKVGFGSYTTFYRSYLNYFNTPPSVR